MTAPSIRLNPADLGEAVALSRHVGWNQNEADWRRLLDLGHGVGIRDDGELVATATSIGYGGRVAWIGMVIVHESRRGKGLGKAVLRRALEVAVQTGTVGLDATQFGQPLYRAEGFEPVRGIDRWSGSLRMASGPGAEEAGPDELAGIAAFDRQTTGVDRGVLLNRLVSEPATSTWVTRNGSDMTGYGILRPGREQRQLGPLVAAGEAEVLGLLRAVTAHLDGEPLLMDVLDRDLMPGLLDSSGLSLQRQLVRMSRGGRGPTLTGNGVRLAAGLELG